ncbi:MAG: ABC transporter substrate-binding protein [Paracoccus sp. (in: a-proteobacteria)]|uniref:ABC transporter substrate-binding protein n=1 Tax=Paracoccus sp. TaxID=267 RepID=UPI0026DEB750|nr:ABC transporter substrate-binding protein [Paracoccus sp. (in: a-proteobacteria)]MDO5612315.1 ABC transporter substrate-binding protein [Paracoccus sp. (in: a-proteobacteria)]
MTSSVLKNGAAVLALTVAGAALPVSAGELVYWSMWNENEPQAEALKEIMANYTAANPDTTFNVVWNGRQNQTKLRQALAARTPVDLMDQDSDQLAGGLQLQDQLRDLSGDLTDEVKAALLPGVLSLYGQGDTIAQLPYIYNTVNFWYDKEALAEIGAPPATWDDLIALCGAARAADTHLLVIEGNVAFYNAAYFSHYLARRNGADAMLAAFADKSGEGWNDPAVLEAAKAGRQLWDAECIAQDARGFQYPAGQQTIAMGETVGELVGSWLPTELSATTGPDFGWGAFNFPAVADGKGKTTDLEVAMVSIAILKDAPNADEAAGFLNYLMGAEAQTLLAEKGGVGVTRGGVTWPGALAEAETAAAEATALTPYGGGLNVLYPEFTSQVLQPEYNRMFLGETTPEQFVERLVAETKKYWDSQN